MTRKNNKKMSKRKFDERDGNGDKDAAANEEGAAKASANASSSSISSVLALAFNGSSTGTAASGTNNDDNGNGQNCQLAKIIAALEQQNQMLQTKNQLLEERLAEVEKKLEAVPSPARLKSALEHVTILWNAKRLCGTSYRNAWNESKSTAKISGYKFEATSGKGKSWKNALASIAFYAGRTDRQPETIIYYYEVTILGMNDAACSSFYRIGFSDGTMPADLYIGEHANTYSLPNGVDFCVLDGKLHEFERAPGAIGPKWNSGFGGNDVIGCGILVGSDKKVAIFYTHNGILMGNQIPIRLTNNYLFYPTVSLREAKLRANFAGPFRYDVEKCQGLVFFDK